MKSRFLISIIIAAGLVCRFFGAAAQCPNLPELNVSATLYTQENGLSTNVLTRIAKDSMGFRYFLGVDIKWIRYDGAEFTRSYGEKEASFDRTEFWQGPQGVLKFKGPVGYRFTAGKGHVLGWAVANDSLICIDTLRKKRQVYRLPATITRQLLNYAPDDDVCWLTTARDVYRFELSSKTFVPVAVPVESVPIPATIKPMEIFFRSDGVPFLPYYNVVLQLDRHSSSVKKLCNISPGQFSVAASLMVINDHLYATYTGCVFNELDLETGAVNTFDISASVRKINAAATVNAIGGNYRGEALICTSDAGIFLFNTCNHSVQRIKYEQKIARAELGHNIMWMAVDDEDVIWVQTEAGLIKMEVNKQEISTYQPSSVEPQRIGNNCNNIRAVYPADSGHLVIGSLEGTYVFDLAQKKIRPLVFSEGRQAVGCIAGDGKGTLFLGNYGFHGILLYNEGSKKQARILDVDQQSDFFCNIANCLLYDSHHTLWVGNNNGILRIGQLDKFIAGGFKGRPDVVTGFPQSGGRHVSQPKAACSAIAEDGQGNIWVGAWDGLYIYNPAKGSVTKYIHDPANPRSISDNGIRSICLSKTGGAWIGTLYGGLNHFDIGTGSFTAYTTDDGLPNNSIYTILEDNNGFLWLGTNAGLCRFNKNDHSVRNYTPRDGLQNFEFNTNAACNAANGLLCFGGSTGFNVFHPDSLSNGFAPPKATITRFKIFDKEYPSPVSVLELNHEQNSFSFEFASLSYYRSSDLQYAYMLDGADKDWIKSGNRHFTSYAHLPPGRYTFKVRVANYTGVWSKETTTLAFIISPAWYNTWWSRLALAFLVAAGIYSLYSYRIGQMRQLYGVRNRIASDLHDEIGSTLSSISLSSTMIQRKLQASDTAVNSLLLQVSSSTSNMLEALGDIVWAINTHNDRFDNVVNRMRAFAIELLEPADIRIHFNVGDGLSDLNLGMQQRKNLYLIFKEAVNNTVKYAACKNVTIHIGRKGKKTLVLEIRDDGKGFDPANLDREHKSLSGNGIRNMQKRAGDLGGKLEIVSAPQKGTGILLRFTI